MPMTKSGLEWFQIVCVWGGGEEGGCSHFCWGVVLIVLQSLLREGMGWAREWVGKMWASACDSLCGWVVLSVCAAETCRNWLVKIFAVSKLTWCLTSPETMRLVRDGEKGVWRWGERETVYLLLHRMTSALRWGEMRAILMFHNCEGQSHKTVSTDHYLWRKKRAKAGSNRGPSAYHPNALLLGQTGSLYICRLVIWFLRSVWKVIELAVCW